MKLISLWIYFRNQRKSKPVKQIGILRDPHLGRYSSVDWVKYKPWVPSHWEIFSPERPRRLHMHTWEIVRVTTQPKYKKNPTTEIYFLCPECSARKRKK